MKKILLSILFLFVFVEIDQVQAAQIPSFPACVNPSGYSLKVKYDSGKHAIVGDTIEIKEGKDEVYWLTEGNAFQCLCPTDGDGVQTNWWKIKDMSLDEIEAYKKQGWYFIPNGAGWGLEEGEYLAKNWNYSCKGGSGGGSTTSTSTSGGIGGVGDVLAATGDNYIYLALASLGIAFIVGGLKLRKLQ